MAKKKGRAQRALEAAHAEMKKSLMLEDMGQGHAWDWSKFSEARRNGKWDIQNDPQWTETLIGSLPDGRPFEVYLLASFNGFCHWAWDDLNDRFAVIQTKVQHPLGHGQIGITDVDWAAGSSYSVNSLFPVAEQPDYQEHYEEEDEYEESDDPPDDDDEEDERWETGSGWIDPDDDEGDAV